MKAILIAITLTLGGCATGYHADSEPTAATVAQAGGVQVYKGTAYLPGDFKADGTLRAFHDYDFMTESAPCTVLPIYRAGAVAQEKTYAITADRGAESFRLLFQCRDSGRLYLLMSKADCSSRTWERGRSSLPFYQEVDNQCSRNRQGLDLRQIDSALHRFAALSVYFKSP